MAANKRGMGKMALWADHICNHFWFCCKHCFGDVEELQVNQIGVDYMYFIFIKTLWISLLHHVQNEHV